MSATVLYDPYLKFQAVLFYRTLFFFVCIITIFQIQPLQAATDVQLVRGPYLQVGTPTSMVIRWRTDKPTSSVVKFGLAPGLLLQSVSEHMPRTEHVLQLTGLTPQTQYWYAIYSANEELGAGNNMYFRTSPQAGSNTKTRIWALGDCGVGDQSQVAVKQQYLAFSQGKPTDVLLLLGDNAYGEGTDSQYQNNFFGIYQSDILKNTVMWPTPGNHDYANNKDRQKDYKIPYYDIFSVPTQAQAGGMASGNKAYYAFDYANIHFISLDSYGQEGQQQRLYDTLSPQIQWLKQDLAANKQAWTVVYFHHPPYTKGSHNSDNEPELRFIRNNLLRILERYKVDLVLTGHSHCYERSYLLQGHYGESKTFKLGTHTVSSSSGKYGTNGTACPYVKNAATQYRGTVYVVAGSAGRVSQAARGWPHKAMYYANNKDAGSLAIEVEGNRLEAFFVCADGQIRDRFSIIKDANKVTHLTAQPGDSVVLKASWTGTYNWSPLATKEAVLFVRPQTDTSFVVNDNKQCLQDVFYVHMGSSGQRNEVAYRDRRQSEQLFVKLYPNPVSDKLTISCGLPDEGNILLNLLAADGHCVHVIAEGLQAKGVHEFSLDVGAQHLASGMYCVMLRQNGRLSSSKLLVL